MYSINIPAYCLTSVRMKELNCCNNTAMCNWKNHTKHLLQSMITTLLYITCSMFMGVTKDFDIPQTHTPHTTTVLGPFFRDHPGEPVPEENFWTLWCKPKLTEANTPTIRLGATPSRLTSAHLHHIPHIFFTGRTLFLPPNQQCQSTEGN